MITESTLIIDKSVSLLSQYDPTAPKSVSVPVSISRKASTDSLDEMIKTRSLPVRKGGGSSRGSKKDEGSRKGSSRGQKATADGDAERPVNPAVAAELDNDLHMTPLPKSRSKPKAKAKSKGRSKPSKAEVAAAKLALETEQAVLAHIPGTDEDGEAPAAAEIKQEAEVKQAVAEDPVPKRAPAQKQRKRRNAVQAGDADDFVVAMYKAAHAALPELIAKTRAEAEQAEAESALGLAGLLAQDERRLADIEEAAALEDKEAKAAEPPVAEDTMADDAPKPVPATKQRKRKSSAKDSAKGKPKRRKVAKETKSAMDDDGDDGKTVAVSYPAAVVLLPKKAKRHHVDRDSLSSDMLRRNINKPAVHKLKQLGSIPRWEGECAMLTRMLMYSITSTYVRNASRVLFHSKRRKLTSKAIIYAAETNGHQLYSKPD